MINLDCKQIFDHYYGLMSNEMRADVERYESLPKDVPLPPGAVREGSIRIVFKDNSWIRVYKKSDNTIEWY